MSVTMLDMCSSIPRRSRSLAALPDSRSPKVASTSLPPSKRRILALRGSIFRKSSLSTRLDSSAIWPAISTPVGPPPTTTKVSHSCRFAGSSSSSAISKAPEDAAAKLEGVVDRLHPGRPARELVVAEVGLAGAGGDDQAVVRDLDGASVGARGRELSSLEVEAVDLGELDVDVPLAVENAAERRCDLALREDPGGDLVEHRLEEVVVVAVHERHSDRGATQPARGEQAPEASAHDHDSMGLGGHRQSVKPP